MTDNCATRRAGADDAARLEQCIDAAYAAYADRIDDLPPVSADCAGEIANHLVWVAEIGDRIVGGLVLVPNDDAMLLANVAVHPDFHGRGIGQKLMRLAEAESRSLGYAEMRLSTHAGMPENIRLYGRNGWVWVGRQGNKVTMKKALART